MKSMNALPTPGPRLPDPTRIDTANPDEVRDYLASLTSTLMTQLQRRPPVGTTQGSRMFTAPNGTVYAVKVRNDGTVYAEPLGSTNANVLPPV
jgi:hypothetical protein